MRRENVVVVNHSMFSENENPFEILGILPAFEIDKAALDQAYFVRQSLVHPDRFMTHSELERQAAQAHSSLLNQAYEALKNSTLRAKALLKLRGIEVPDHANQSIQDPQVLEEAMILRETLTKATSISDLTLLEKQIHEQLREVHSDFSKALQNSNDHELLRLFLRLTYLSKFMDEICRQIRETIGNEP